ncbi:MAG: D-alanine--D-alanine ligase family protein [Cyclobacteriaceae bacterium]
MKKNLIVICGGVSPEHDISVRSMKNVLGALDRDKYSIQVIGISKEGKWFLIEDEQAEISITGGIELSIRPGRNECFFTSKGSLGKTDVIFPLLHGPNGEDGAIQGLLKLLQIPFVGPGILGSAASMDKDITKQLLVHNGIKVADWILLRKGQPIPSYSEIAKRLGDVIFVKPANMGSSVGVSRVSNPASWDKALAEAFMLDKKVLVERLLEGREIECAVMGNETPQASGVGEVVSGEVYSYEEKYADTSTAQVIIPAKVSEDELVKLKETAVTSYRTLECKGLSRVDMFLTKSGEVFVNEINTMPGFTSISMFPKLWAQEGIGYSQLLDRLIELALAGD